MSSNAYTQKSMEAINAAQAEAKGRGQQQLEQAHLLYALFREDQGLIPQLFRKMEKDPESFRDGIESILSPKDSDRKNTRMNSSHTQQARMPISA